MTKTSNSRPYDLENRTLRFAKDVIDFINCLPRTLTGLEICKQLIRSAGSVGANYIEANESLSRKDLLMRLKICRKEAKESRYWLQLIDCNEELKDKHIRLVQEATELLKIFTAIIEKVK